MNYTSTKQLVNSQLTKSKRFIFNLWGIITYISNLLNFRYNICKIGNHEYRLLLVSSLILCSLIGCAIIQIPQVLASSDNQTGANNAINKTIHARIFMVTNLNETLANPNPSTQSNPDSNTNPSKLPKWIKSTFIAYSQGDISEDELLNAITYLVQNDIIKIQAVSQSSTTPNPSPTTNTSNHVITNPSKLPKWIKSTFIAYSQGDISEDELLNAITYLVQNDIIKIQSVSQLSATTNNSSSTVNTSNQPIVTNFDFSKINANADNYQNRLGIFSGRITGIDTQKGVTGITLQLEEYSTDTSMYVIFTNQDISQYLKGDCVSVQGSIKARDKDPSAFGALSPYPKLNGNSIDTISCLDALYPALKTINLNLSQKAGNVLVNVSKIQFAEKHTRVFVTIWNLNTDRQVYFSGHQIVQNQSRYNLISNAAGEKGIGYMIMPETIAKGYKFYDPVPQQSFRLNLEVREQFLSSRDKSDDYNSLDHVLTFDIPIQ